MNDLISCSFNPKHKIKASNKNIHEGKCPDRKDLYQVCKFNPTHRILKTQFENHVKNCPSKPREQFLVDLDKYNENLAKLKMENPETIESNQNNKIIGMKPKLNTVKLAKEFDDILENIDKSEIESTVHLEEIQKEQEESELETFDLNFNEENNQNKKVTFYKKSYV